mgnify:FL=1
MFWEGTDWGVIRGRGVALQDEQGYDGVQDLPTMSQVGYDIERASSKLDGGLNDQGGKGKKVGNGLMRGTERREGREGSG